MKAIDLFAGCGGLSLGLIQAGIDAVAVGMARALGTVIRETFERFTKGDAAE